MTRSVSQFDPDTRTLVKTFGSIAKAAEMTGIGKELIHQAASGKLHYARGYIWTFESPDTFVPPTREQV